MRDFRCECGGWADTGNAGFCNYCVEKFGPPMPAPSKHATPDRVWVMFNDGRWIASVDPEPLYSDALTSAALTYIPEDTSHDAIERAVREAFYDDAAAFSPAAFIDAIMRRLREGE